MWRCFEGLRPHGKAWLRLMGWEDVQNLRVGDGWQGSTKLASIGYASYDLLIDVATVSPKYQIVIPKRVREQFGLTPGQQSQVIALPGRIELVPSLPPGALRGFLQGENTFEREPDRL